MKIYKLQPIKPPTPRDQDTLHSSLIPPSIPPSKTFTFKIEFPFDIIILNKLIPPSSDMAGTRRHSGIPSTKHSENGINFK